MWTLDDRVVKKMSAYSERSQELACELAAKAAKNLSRSGKTVTVDSSGRYVVVGRRAGGAFRSESRGKSDR